MPPEQGLTVFCLVLLAVTGVFAWRRWQQGEVTGEQAIENWFKGFSYCLGGIACFWLGVVVIFGSLIYLADWLGG